MKRNLIFIVLCAFSLMLGAGMGIHVSEKKVFTPKGSAREGRSRPGDVLPASGDLPNLQDRQQRLRSILARCDTEVLWSWLATYSEHDEEVFRAAIEELMDRLGWKVFDQSLEIEDARLRSRLSDGILGLFALKDPWKAFEIYKMHRADFADSKWGRTALDSCVFAAADVSADKMLEVFGEMPSKESEIFVIAAYRPDFDFRKVLDDLVSSKEAPGSVPENLISEWAKRSPSEAAGWLAGHSEFMNHEIIEYRGRLVLETIATFPVRAERDQALESAGRLPDTFLDNAWSAIGGQQKGKLEPGFLEAADRMGRRGPFLTEVLLSTRDLEEIDSSWKALPVEERMAVLTAAESKWADEVDTPLARRARGHWRTMVLQAWKSEG